MDYNYKGKRVKKVNNNTFSTDEILWLLDGNESMSAKDFICRCVLNVEPENFEDVFE